MIDLAKQSVFHTINYDSKNIEWFGQEGGRGLRGIALDGETVYIAASHCLLAYNRQFKLIGSWRNPYLANCHDICIHQRKLFMVSTDNDSILSFDLDEKKFHWALQIQSDDYQYRPLAFDPMGSDGPLFINKLHLKNIRCGESGLFISGSNTEGVLHFNGESIRMMAELPRGAQDARMFRNGFVFNDSRAGVLRYSGDNDGSEDRALEVPYFVQSDHAPLDSDEDHMLKRGYGRGLCVLSGTVVAGGSTPAGISLYNLKENKRLLTVRFTKNTRETVNCIEVWQE